ncbi:MAG: enoyl-CoA hydratase/isomerase family protein [Myxococcota bacterium]
MPNATEESSAARPAVAYAREGAIGWIRLQRPENRNSMTPELLAAFAEASAEAKADPDARVVVIAGEGRCFSAGADFKATLQLEGGLPHERSYAMYAPFLSVLDIEVPVIGALNGHAVGGGFGLALVCDMRIAHEDAKYGANFVRLGLHSGMAISYLLPRLVGVPNAFDLLLGGRLVSGREAAQIGLVNAACPGDEVVPRAKGLAEAIAENAPLVVKSIKRAVREGLEWDPRSAALREAAIQAGSLETRDAKEGMAALLEKRDPQFEGR